MKNIKLLLATTAMISISAVTANADTSPVGTLSVESTQVQAKAEIIHARSLSATPLDFGKIVTSGGNVSVNIDRDGNESVAEGYEAINYILQKGSTGVVTGATCEELNWEKDLDSMESELTLHLTTKPAGVRDANVNDIACYTENGKAIFYGALFISAAPGVDIVPAGEYSGSFTVTVIESAYPVTTPDEGD